MKQEPVSVAEIRGLFAPGDKLVCWASFEARSGLVYDVVGTLGERHVYASRQHEYPFGGAFSGLRVGAKSSEVEWLDRDNQVVFFDSIQSLLNEAKWGTIWFDVTCFPREFLSVLIRVLCGRPQSDWSRFRLLYSLARDYSVGAQVDDKWLVKGVQSVTSILGFRGRRRPGAPTVLVGMLGFDIDRFLAISDEVVADKFVLGIGGTLFVEKEWMQEKNRRAVGTLKALLEFDGEFIFSCDDVRECFRDVESVVNRYPTECDIVIVNLNNKISVIATALLALRLPHIRLCHSSGIVYNWERYSEPSGKVAVLSGSDFLGLGVRYLSD